MGAPHKPPLNIPDDVATLAYIAGLFDGEGCIWIKSQRSPKGWLCHHAGVEIVNTAESVLHWIVQQVGGGSVHELRRYNANAKRCYTVRWYGKNAEALMGALLPYLRIKRREAEIFLAFREQGRRVSGRHLSPSVVAFRQECAEELRRAKTLIR